MDIVIDAVGRRLDNVGALYVEFSAVLEKGVGVEFRDLHDRLILTLRALEHFILARIGIRSQVSDVGDIHNALDVISGIAKRFFEDILHNVRAQISDMRKVIYGRATGVHFDKLGIVRDKFLTCSCGGVIQFHRFLLGFLIWGDVGKEIRSLSCQHIADVLKAFAKNFTRRIRSQSAWLKLRVERSRKARSSSLQLKI